MRHFTDIMINSLRDLKLSFQITNRAHSNWLTLLWLPGRVFPNLIINHKVIYRFSPSQLSGQRKTLKRHVLNILTPEPTIRWYWSADTFFWQLSMDHNVEVYHQVSTQAKNVISLDWFSCGAVGRTGGRRVEGRTVTWLPNFLVQ